MSLKWLVLLCAFSLPPAWGTSNQCSLSLGTPIAAEDFILRQRQVIRGLAQDIEGQTRTSLERAQAEIVYDGKKDFFFAANRGVVRELLQRISLKRVSFFADPEISNEELAELEAAGRRLLLLNSEATPYRATVEWVFRYLELQDKIARRTPPDGVKLTYFHTSYGRKRLSELLESAPEVLIVFDFGLSPPKALLTFQSAPFKVVAVNEASEFADAFWLSPAEAAFHDVGHSWLSNMRDNLVARKRGISVAELHRRGRRINRILDEETRALALVNRPLAEALTVYRFEVHHERGMPVELKVLQDEANTRLRVASLEYKIRTGFFGTIDVPRDLAERVDQARLLLQQILARNTDLSEYDAPEVGEPIYVDHFQLAYEEHGTYVETHVVSPEEILVEFETRQGQHVKANLADISLAQIVAQDRVPADIEDLSETLDNYDRFRLRQLRTLQMNQESVPFIVEGESQVTEGIYRGRYTDAQGRIFAIIQNGEDTVPVPWNQILY